MTTEETTACPDLSLPQRVEEGAPLFGLRFLEVGPPRKNHVVAIPVQFYDLGFYFLPYEGFQIADPAKVDQRGWQEAPQPDIDYQTTLDDLYHGSPDRTPLFADRFDLPPHPFVKGAFLGEDQPTLLVFLLEDQDLDLVSDGHDLAGRDVLADGEFFQRYDAFGFVTDVDQDLVLLDVHHRSFDDVTLFELQHRLGDGCCEVLRSDVVGE